MVATGVVEATAAKLDFRTVTLDEAEAFSVAQGWPRFRGEQIWRWVHDKAARSFDDMTNLGRETRARLAETATIGGLEIAEVQTSHDGTRKLRLVTHDGQSIESVLIPDGDKTTQCISSQVGCAVDCQFCATAKMGLTRNLDAGEIVDQLLAIEAESGEKIDNIVFMGMGEPLANLTNLLRAIRIINAPWGLEIGARHITISTSGLAPQIRKLAQEPTQFRLAISLHGATDEVRSQIMPVNRKYNLATLLDACDEYVARKKRLMFEYILIAGVNDTDAQAHALARHALRLSAKINLIPYNTVEGLEWSRPSRNRQETFLRILREQGAVATLRREKGHDIAAACGQLRLQSKRAEHSPLPA